MDVVPYHLFVLVTDPGQLKSGLNVKNRARWWLQLNLFEVRQSKKWKLIASESWIYCVSSAAASAVWRGMRRSGGWKERRLKFVGVSGQNVVGLISPNMIAASHDGAVFVCRSGKAVELLWWAVSLRHQHKGWQGNDLDFAPPLIFIQIFKLSTMTREKRSLVTEW